LKHCGPGKSCTEPESCGWRQGVPLRLELGPKDLEKGSVLVARRDTGAKEVVPWADLPARVPALLDQIQARSTACRKGEAWGGPGGPDRCALGGLPARQSHNSFGVGGSGRSRPGQTWRRACPPCWTRPRRAPQPLPLTAFRDAGVKAGCRWPLERIQARPTAHQEGDVGHVCAAWEPRVCRGGPPGVSMHFGAAVCARASCCMALPWETSSM